MSALDFEKMDGQEIQERLSACIMEAERELEKLRQQSENFEVQMNIIAFLINFLLDAGFRFEDIVINTVNMQGDSRTGPRQHVKVAVDAGKGHGWVFAAN